MYNSIKYTNNNSKISSSLWQHYRDKPNTNLADSETFKSKIKITGSTPADGNTNYVKIAVSLKYLNKFWRTPEMSLNNCEINLILTQPTTCAIISSTGVREFAITNTKRYALVVTLSTQDNAKQLEKLKSDFKRTINWNKYQSKVAIKRQNQYSNFLTDPGF